MAVQSKSILDHIGNTPLVEVSRMSPKPGVRIFAKLEGLNPTGSIKDRVAGYLVRQAEESGRRSSPVRRWWRPAQATPRWRWRSLPSRRATS